MSDSQGIYICQPPSARTPPHVDELKRSLSDLSPLSPALIGYDPTIFHIAEAVEGGPTPELREAIARASVVKDMQPNSFSGRVESAWMHLNRRIMSVITECDAFRSSEDVAWTAAVGPVSADSRPLSIPKPDIGVRLRIIEKTELQMMSSPTHARNELLTEPVLGLLNSHAAFRLIATPSTGLEEVAFPFLIYEAKSDSSSLFFAENQSAGGAAKALSLLQQLSSYYEDQDTIPVFALASCGTLWEAFIAFYQEESESYHLLPISRKLDQACDIDIFHLQLILLRIRNWVLSTYKPKIELTISRLLREYRGQTK